MIVRKVYSGSEITGSTFLAHIRLFKITTVILFFLFPGKLVSQDLPEYDEIPISLEIPRVGGGEIDALIKAEELYLPITDLFDFMKIRNVPSSGLETISGFFISPDATYEINRVENRILFQDRIFKLEEWRSDPDRIQSVPEIIILW